MQTREQLASGELDGSRQLKLSSGLTTFPREIFRLADTLEVLDLSGNALSSLPEDLPRLHRLRILFCSDNRFETLPPMLGRCPSLDMIGFKSNRIATVPDTALPARLRWLILTDNRIAALPDALGDCTGLRKLMLAGNRLDRLPDTMARCTELELLRIAANRFAVLPDWLFALPRLAWLAFAGNPSARIPSAEAERILWSDLDPGPRLGEGASGVIHLARHHQAPGRSRDVAVKLFKGAMTSDGLPRNEMAACLHAGRHPGLIPVLGQVAGHPDGREGLVMERIDPAFANLAGPPSLASCTRDIYAPDRRFDTDTVIRLALGIADTARHLHARGILHGDLYGHNILENGQGQALLGDFGAATCFDPADVALAEALQQLEVRAFGYLLEELLARCTGPDDHGPLHALCADCLATPGNRPSFDTVCTRLRALGTQRPSARPPSEK